MKSEQAEQNYAKFSASPDRIDGSIHNTTTARLGVAFNYNAMEQVDAVEIAFTIEPHGNMRSIMVVDINAARSLRNMLDVVLDKRDANVRRAMRNAARAKRKE
jgi:alkyl hydroperoxide reductase subunit AhpC